MALEPEDLDPDPIRQLAAWLDQAAGTTLRLPGAMALATADPNGSPSVRVLLLRGLDARGLVFYTNHHSRKGRDLAANPRAAASLYWEPLDRQVRASGRVERLDPTEAGAYFATRERGSQLAAWASRQSEPVESRSALEDAWMEADRRFAGRAIDLPPWWGGYRLVPDAMEFWQSAPHRLHDRIAYQRLTDGTWRRRRLQP